MTTRNLVILMICASSIAICANNNAAVRGPVTGYIFDAQAHAIRPMMGIPGAAYLGSPVVSNVDSASVSPDGSAAFAIQAGKLVVYTGLASASPTAVYLHGSIPADRFAWAPGATAAAIYSSKSTQAQIVSNLPGTLSASAPIDLSALSGQVEALAFDAAAAIYSSKSTQAQIVSNLPGTLSASAPIDLSALSGQVEALAFDAAAAIYSSKSTQAQIVSNL